MLTKYGMPKKKKKNSAVENQYYSIEDFINLHWQDGLINKSRDKSDKMRDTTFK